MKTIAKIFAIFLIVAAIFLVYFLRGSHQDNKGIYQPREWVKVIRVVDGDTIEIESLAATVGVKREKVRLIGINTPETVDPRKPIECFGKEASVKTKELVLGKSVYLEKDIENRDKYGRLLRYVWLGGKMLNLTLMERGYAQIETVPPNVKYARQFKEAAEKARASQLGLWSICKLF